MEITSLEIWMFCVIGMVVAYAISALVCKSKGKENRRLAQMEEKAADQTPPNP